MSLRSVAAVLAFVCLMPVARAQDDEGEPEPEPVDPVATREDPSDEDRGPATLNLSSSRGLTGMRELIDARTPKGAFRGRINLRTSYSLEHTRTKGGAWERARRRYEIAIPVAGFSVYEHLDLGIRLPIPSVHHVRTHARLLNGPDQVVRHRNGIGGNASLSAKGSVSLGPIAFGGYLTLSPQTGGKSQDYDEGFMELASCITISVLGDLLAIHGNVGGFGYFTRNVDAAFRYRAGVSLCPVNTKAIALRLFCYGEGLELEGSPGSDLRIGAGVQMLVNERFQIEVSGDGRIMADHLDMGNDDRQTWGVELGFGFLF